MDDALVKRMVERNVGTEGQSMAAECKHCDGTGSACFACNAGIMDCNCGPDQEPTMCDVCGGTGDMSDDDMAAQNDEIEKSERYGA